MLTRVGEARTGTVCFSIRCDENVALGYDLQLVRVN